MGCIVLNLDLLALMNHRYFVEHDLMQRDRIVKLGREVFHQRQHDVREHNAPSVGRVFGGALVDADVMKRITAIHEVRIKQPGGAPQPTTRILMFGVPS